MSCECRNCLPITKFSWIYENSTNIEVSKVEYPSRNQFMSFLTINNIKSDQMGYYKCRFENNKGVDEVEVAVTVRVPPVITKVSISSDFNTTIVDRRYLIKEGKSYEVLCEAESYPRPKISWKLNGELLIEENFFGIMKASVNDEGIYECVAQNDFKSSSKRIQIQMNFPPKTDSPKSSDLSFEVDSQVTLTCDIYGRPEPEFKWKFNGDEVDYSKLEFEDNRQILKFTAAEDAEGTFTCEGTNNFGSASMDFAVKITSMEILKRNMFKI